jgi:hypothetical protein
MLQTKVKEIWIRVKEEINKQNVQDIFQLILLSVTVEEFVQRYYILNDICDRLYQTYHINHRTNTEYYTILNKVEGIYEDQITHLIEKMLDHKFNVYFQNYLLYRNYHLDILLKDDSRKTKLSEYSKELLERFLEESTHQDQEKVIHIFYNNNRKDILLLISKGFGISLRNFNLQSSNHIETDKDDEIHIEISEEIN